MDRSRKEPRVVTQDGTGKTYTERDQMFSEDGRVLQSPFGPNVLKGLPAGAP